MIWECEEGRLASVALQATPGDMIAMNGSVHLIMYSKKERGGHTVYLAPDPDRTPDPEWIIRLQIGSNNEIFCTPIKV